MPSPRDPDKIVFRNSVYPIGLTSNDLYSYYIRHKQTILKEAEGKKILLFNSFEPGKNLTIIRNTPEGLPLILRKNNFEQIISGYTISISMETPDITDYMVVDIDYNGRVQESQLKNAAMDIFLMFSKKAIMESSRITNSSTGYHVYGYLKREMNIDKARDTLMGMLRGTFTNKYGIGRTSTRPGIKLDISPMYKRGSITIPTALTREGIVCDYVDNIYKFNRAQRRIK